EFVPYKYGSYSFQLAEDWDILYRDKYLSVENTPEITMIKAVGNYPHENSFKIATERGEALIRKAYREYPYYTINSEIIDRLFRGEELERLRNIKQTYIKTDQVLFSIGYEGRSVEAFVNTLIQNDIRLLCDVRKNPLSRKFGFSKSKLKHITQTIGIEYVHIPDLGIESDKRDSLETIEDYNRLFDNYANTLPSRSLLLEQVYMLLCSNVRIALMCYERKPEMCHRHVIRDYIVKTHQITSMDL
ncbi:MAG: DUF488 domain-containing protein, partial [Planctomycetaceae bacterium]|nr:DUF488 domain-containing protein [Planctomycetaceae bacterium]